MSLRDRIAKALEADPDADAREVAEALLPQVTKRDLFPLLVEEVQGHQRRRVRQVERRAFGQSGGGTAPSMLERSRPRLAELYGEPFKLYDGREVSWGQATVEQHRQRLERLRVQRHGLTQTIERHEEAIRTCEEHGVDRLADIGAAGEAAA